MAELAEADYLRIKSHPLQPSIGHLREQLRVTPFPVADLEQRDASPAVTRKSPKTEAASDSVGAFKDAKGLVVELLHALQFHIVGKTLQSGTGPIGGQLAEVSWRLQADLINTAAFLPIITAVAQDVPSDIQTWKTVLCLVSSILHRTPPTSTSHLVPRTIPLSYGGTPRKLNSGSHRGSEQTRDLLTPELRRELLGCTYVHVDGFYEKYFERDRINTKLIQDIKGEHKGNRWANFPNPPTEPAVWNWLDDLQKQYLRDARGVYYSATSTSELTGTDTKWQLDLFLKHRDAPSQEKHEWADVRVVGEHKRSRTSPNEKFLQLAYYVREVFKTQPTRRFMHAFLILGTTLEPFVFDRCGAYSGVPLNIDQEPERFLQVLLGYITMSDEQLGLDTFVDEEGRHVTVKGFDGAEQRLQLTGKPIFTQSAIVSRGTSCYRTHSHQVVKFSWRPDQRQPEAELFNLAHERGVQGVVHLVGAAEITSIARLREGLVFDRMRNLSEINPTAQSFSQSQSQSKSITASPRIEGLSLQHGKQKSTDARTPSSKKRRFNGHVSSLSKVKHVEENSQAGTQSATRASAVRKDEPFHNRVLTCLALSPHGRPLHEFNNIEELLRCLRDAIKAHRSLFINGRILHRDISSNNIIITSPEDEYANGFYGMLIDLDLSTQVDAARKNQRSGAVKITGTLKYMAIEVIMLAFREDQPDLEHTYRHDLESFFYVFVEACVSCRPGKRGNTTAGARHDWRNSADPLMPWYTGSFVDITDKKYSHMVRSRFEYSILRLFSPEFECLKPLACDLRDQLFGTGDQLYTGTPSIEEGKESLYEGMIKAFDKALQDL